MYNQSLPHINSMGGVVGIPSKLKTEIRKSQPETVLNIAMSHPQFTSSQKKSAIGFHRRAEYSEFKLGQSGDMFPVVPMVDLLLQSKHPEAQERCLRALSEVLALDIFHSS